MEAESRAQVLAAGVKANDVDLPAFRKAAAPIHERYLAERDAARSVRRHPSVSREGSHDAARSATPSRIALACAAIASRHGARRHGRQAWQVFARYVLNDAPSWTEPVALLCMSTTMMFGAAAGVHAASHFGFFIVVEHARRRVASRSCSCVARLIATLVGVAVRALGRRDDDRRLGLPIAGAPLPQGIMFLPLCLGGALIALFCDRAAAHGAIGRHRAILFGVS